MMQSETVIGRVDFDVILALLSEGFLGVQRFMTPTGQPAELHHVSEIPTASVQFPSDLVLLSANKVRTVSKEIYALFRRSDGFITARFCQSDGEPRGRTSIAKIPRVKELKEQFSHK
ncbi:hypothetical protein AVEN_255271-1 [Araneus ventricosus]|uniref:Uncharacterized protein n=1 Tax=Araneus ventricosus TaxID=182803 RepID=A0A4Y2BCE4_ARAVE|nr:hypothetical protein AVEN_255271-1 [Araneus ventricosus]